MKRSRKSGEIRTIVVVFLEKRCPAAACVSDCGCCRRFELLLDLFEPDRHPLLREVYFEAETRPKMTSKWTLKRTESPLKAVMSSAQSVFATFDAVWKSKFTASDLLIRRCTGEYHKQSVRRGLDITSSNWWIACEVTLRVTLARDLPVFQRGPIPIQAGRL